MVLLWFCCGSVCTSVVLLMIGFFPPINKNDWIFPPIDKYDWIFPPNWHKTIGKNDCISPYQQKRLDFSSYWQKMIGFFLLATKMIGFSLLWTKMVGFFLLSTKMMIFPPIDKNDRIFLLSTKMIIFSSYRKLISFFFSPFFLRGAFSPPAILARLCRYHFWIQGKSGATWGFFLKALGLALDFLTKFDTARSSLSLGKKRTIQRSGRFEFRKNTSSCAAGMSPKCETDTTYKTYWPNEIPPFEFAPPKSAFFFFAVHLLRIFPVSIVNAGLGSYSE